MPLWLPIAVFVTAIVAIPILDEALDLDAIRAATLAVVTASGAGAALVEQWLLPQWLRGPSWVAWPLLTVPAAPNLAYIAARALQARSRRIRHLDAKAAGHD